MDHVKRRFGGYSVSESGRLLQKEKEQNRLFRAITSHSEITSEQEPFLPEFLHMTGFLSFKFSFVLCSFLILIQANIFKLKLGILNFEILFKPRASKN